MDERRKIIIPIGNDPASESEQTFFDTQARKDARPVVPLAEGSSTGPAIPGTRSRKRVVVAVFLVTALAAAVSAGAYVYLTRDRGQSGPLAAVQPVAGKALSTLSWTHTTKDPATEENTTAAEQAKDARADDTQARTERAANDGDPKKVNKQQKPGKPGKKNANNQNDSPVKQTQDELHRIRDIFEGPP